MTPLNRRSALRRILNSRGELIVVAGLGAPAYDLASCGDEPRDFPLWGGMGGAVMVGLGLALAQPAKTVMVLTGDGEILMGLSSLATVAAINPPNLRIIVMDNGRYGETGGQESHTSMGTDLAAVAVGCGIENARTIFSPEELPLLRQELHQFTGTLFAALKVAPEMEARVLPPRDGPFLCQRMRAALLGEEGVEA